MQFVHRKDGWPGMVSHGLRGLSSFPVTKEVTFVNSPLSERPTSRPPVSYERRVRKAKRFQDEVSADAKKLPARMVLSCANETTRVDRKLRLHNSAIREAH